MSNADDPENGPHTVINARKGVSEYGEIDATAANAAGVQPGAIKLLNGWPGPKGWGWRHITSNPDRVAAITKQGFASPIAYAYEVAQNWVSLHDGPKGAKTRVTICWPQNGYEYGLALEWNGALWTITTMLPFRSIGYAKLYEK